MNRTILVTFNHSRLTSAKAIRQAKFYSFNSNSPMKVGDMIKLVGYETPVQVIKILEEEFKFYNSITGELSNDFTSTAQREIAIMELRSEEPEIIYGSIINTLED